MIRKLLVVIATGIACSTSQPEAGSKPAASEDTLAALRQGVIQLIGEPTCRASGECRVIAFGSKPCGGPRSYLPYSLAVTDSITLADAVRAFNNEDTKNNQVLGLMSDCSVVQEPAVICSQGLCTANQ